MDWLKALPFEDEAITNTLSSWIFSKDNNPLSEMTLLKECETKWTFGLFEFWGGLSSLGFILSGLRGWKEHVLYKYSVLIGIASFIYHSSGTQAGLALDYLSFVLFSFTAMDGEILNYELTLSTKLVLSVMAIYNHVFGALSMVVTILLVVWASNSTLKQNQMIRNVGMGGMMGFSLLAIDSFKGMENRCEDLGRVRDYIHSAWHLFGALTLHQFIQGLLQAEKEKKKSRPVSETKIPIHHEKIK